MTLKFDERSIMWPGKSNQKPQGYQIPTHLKVLTLEEKPFVYVRNSTDSKCLEREILCLPYTSSMKNQGRFEIIFNFCKSYIIPKTNSFKIVALSSDKIDIFFIKIQ